MKVYSEEALFNEKSSTVVLVLSVKEARTLHDAVKAGAAAHKRKTSFRNLSRKLSELLAIW